MYADGSSSDDLPSVVVVSSPADGTLSLPTVSLSPSSRGNGSQSVAGNMSPKHSDCFKGFVGSSSVDGDESLEV